jgi:hypothetical protein
VNAVVAGLLGWLLPLPEEFAAIGRYAAGIASMFIQTVHFHDIESLMGLLNKRSVRQVVIERSTDIEHPPR